MYSKIEKPRKDEPGFYRSCKRELNAMNRDEKRRGFEKNSLQHSFRT